MAIPYRARLNERTLLNLPGFHGGAYVYVYVEDTSERDLLYRPDCDPDCERCPENFEPRITFEICDGEDVVQLGFDVDTEAGRANALHKLDTLLAALGAFRAALIQEFEPYDRREQELEAVHGE